MQDVDAVARHAYGRRADHERQEPESRREDQIRDGAVDERDADRDGVVEGESLACARGGAKDGHRKPDRHPHAEHREHQLPGPNLFRRQVRKPGHGGEDQHGDARGTQESEPGVKKRERSRAC